MGNNISILELNAKLLLTVTAEYLGVDEARGNSVIASWFEIS